MKLHPTRLPVILAAGLLVAACGKDAPPIEEVRPVRYVRVADGSLDAGLTLPGEIRARHEAALGFRVGGKIVSRQVNQGDRVRKGQLIAKLDGSDYALALTAKEAQLNAARVDLAQQEADLARYRELLGKGFISRAQFDKMEASVKAAASRRDQAGAELGASRNQTAYTNLVADADGVISSITAEPGMVVAAGQPVAKLARDGQLEVAVSVPENALAAVRGATRLTVRLWSGNRSYDGVLRELAADADPATRTYPARIAIPKPDDTLRLGMTASVAIPGTTPQGVARLPVTALLDEAGKHFVWLVDEKTLRVKRVQVDVKAVTSEFAAVSGPLAKNALVVTAGVHLLRDNQAVRLLNNP
ncbi:efflux RND transporter periplasmic adaptor subunit [Paludibacterium paludis]|uniref:Resistance-nodulation-cell division (RND) efflux membrane fusion protein n=1 Tax=Paludibacterium paludis TaxID=1225769 RepID=A0A918NZ68_9NEIS|nr:efflux RND transporter periplasmic adaptor subunit [Paludibacterium paludis]GGY08661.1 resistance-nodulation-cell division (RND) efflux membrane fusion protein [Paludibacterium paludis]